MSEKVQVQSLIDHIKSAIDVDPWAKEMAEELLKGQEAIPPVRESDGDPGELASWWYVCGACRRGMDYHDKFCRWCGRKAKWENE